MHCYLHWSHGDGESPSAAFPSVCSWSTTLSFIKCPGFAVRQAQRQVMGVQGRGTSPPGPCLWEVWFSALAQSHASTFSRKKGCIFVFIMQVLGDIVSLVSLLFFIEHAASQKQNVLPSDLSQAADGISDIWHLTCCFQCSAWWIFKTSRQPRLDS